ncbi:MAG: retropepsin-like aspartic protease [Allosphingosinicella sp.]|uniref:retropepsin-like aspartic protease n=1 Tax=Allosphingosinicella sp. TaxID=2823234 RepID=UPI00395D7B5B
MTGRTLLAAALAALLPAAAAAAPLETFRNRLFVAAEVNGAPVAALLDSGAEMSVLDDGFAGRLGLAQAGGATAHGSGAEALEARFAQGVAIKAAGVRIADRTVAVIDLGEVSARLIGRPVDMILGRDLFDAARLRIDIDGGTIDPLPRDAEPAGVRLALASHRGIEAFPAAVEGHATAQAVFDLGNGSEVMVGRAFAERIGLAAPGRIVERRSGGGLGGAVERDVVRLETLDIAGRTFRDIPAAIDDSPTAADLNIGTSMLRHFLITTDFARQSLWLAPHE